MSRTFANATQYPLSWPEGFPRTKRQESSQFKTTLFQALENVNSELRLFAKDSGKKLSEIIISSSYSLSETNPADSGVAVYFTWDGERTCIAVDRYQKIENNLQAIHHCIKAKRTMLRHGGINLVKAAFRGYAALPNPGKKNWRDVLACQSMNIELVKKHYQKLIKKAHPDHGGSDAAAAEINQAWADAQLELK